MPWNSANFTYAGFVTSATATTGGSVQWMEITHPDPGYTYNVHIQMYSPRSNTADNDSGAERAWVYPVNATTTRINMEYTSEPGAQQIGFYLIWLEA